MKYDGKLCFCGQTVHSQTTAHILRQKHFLHWSLSLLPSFTLRVCVLFSAVLLSATIWNGSERKLRRKWFFRFNSFHFREWMRMKEKQWNGKIEMERKWQKARGKKLNSIPNEIHTSWQVDFFAEFETMLPFCHLTKSCAHLNKLHTSNTCVCHKVLFFVVQTRSQFNFFSTSVNKKIEVENFQLVDSFKKFSNEF